MKRVLFVCTHNAGRSQIAQADLERHAPPDEISTHARDENRAYAEAVLARLEDSTVRSRTLSLRLPTINTYR